MEEKLESKIKEILVEPEKIYTKSTFKIKVKVDNKDPSDKPPTITIKTGENETIGNETDGYSKISFKIFDDKGLSEYEINGVANKLSTSQWGDINNVTTSTPGAVVGMNTLIVRDTANNETSKQFKLVQS